VEGGMAQASSVDCMQGREGCQVSRLLLGRMLLTSQSELASLGG
jgi:hypothetical protein